MPKGNLNSIPADEDRLFPVKLKRNYVPASEIFEVTEAVAPPQIGVGTGGKIWAGSVVRLPVDEARGLIADKRAERADELPA